MKLTAEARKRIHDATEEARQQIAKGNFRLAEQAINGGGNGADVAKRRTGLDPHELLDQQLEDPSYQRDYILKAAPDSVAMDEAVVRKFHKACDRWYMVNAILNPTNSPMRKPRTKLEKFLRDQGSYMLRREMLKSQSELAKAMDSTTAAQGDEWVPTSLSGTMIESIRQAHVLATLFPEITMPTNPFDVPVESTDATAYLAGESLDDVSSKFTPSTPGSRKVTLTAKKCATRLIFSEEFQEDSLVAVMDHLENKIRWSQVYAIEDAIINGDTAAGAGDLDTNETMAANDFGRAFDGLREKSREVDANVTATKVECPSALDVSLFTGVFGAMKQYGQPGARTFLLTSYDGWSDIQNVLDKTSGSPVALTADQMGPSNAVLLNGQVGQIFNMPVIVSHQVPQALDDDGYDGGAEGDNTVVLVVNRDTFLVGRKRGLTIKTREDIETDQIVMVATQRVAFSSVFPDTEPYIGQLTETH